ncbi:MAG TPA: helix-turn-helix domain-containing protein [Candidatus Borkfalkia stercoripullorum]|nr:helix-turn-helix domain-containing protein [Candidatus Borkfalkia stercoripullorum]
MNNKLPERLNELLRDRNISQRKLAKAIEVTSATVSAWCRGIKQPTADNIVALAKYFGVSTDYLLGFSDY